MKIQLLVLACALSLSCTKIARPGLSMIQDYLGAYHIEIQSDAPGAAVVSARAVVLTGAARASFKITAPGVDGTRRDIISREVGVGKFRAWAIRLAESDGTWIEVEQIDCQAARELLPEIRCLDNSVTAAAAMSVGNHWEKVERDIVRERIRL